MKNILLVTLLLASSINLLAQSRPVMPASLKNIALQRVKEPRPTLNHAAVQNSFNYEKTLTDLEIGTTMYDLQTNECVDSRCHLFPDGTVGATWTFGSSPTTYPERGSGYNYYDGTAWGAEPTQRIENLRTGWPSYAALGSNEEGEVVVSHAGATNSLIMSTRAVRGTGSWIQTSIPKTAGNVLWPRVCTSGNTIHILASDNDTTVILNGMKCPIYYYRSSDAGATWDIQQVVPAGLETYTGGFGGDTYAWAKPQGNTIAFVIGEQYNDLVLMKSTDAGATWTKTVVFQNPHPSYDVNYPNDTMYVTDGHYAVELDQNGMAHVVFGTTRMLWTSSTQYSFWPVVNGIGIWNEGDATYSGLDALNTDTLFNAGKLVAWVIDHNGDGQIFSNYVSGTTVFAHYGTAGPCSQPQLSIDANGDMYLVYTSAVEDQLSSANVYYNHLYGRKYYASTGEWSDFRELTAGNPGEYDQVEMAFPALSKTMDSQLHIVYQYDFDPGAYVEPFVSPGTIAGSQNVIQYLTVDKSDLILNNKVIDLSKSTVAIYPNPVSDNMNIDFSFTESTPVKMSLYNSVGSLVKSKSFITEIGNSSVIGMKDVPAGIYMVKFETPKGIISRKVIKK